MKRKISKRCIVIVFLLILLLTGIISVQFYVSRKVLPREYTYDISYLLTIAEKTSWEQPSDLADLIRAYEVVCSDWHNNPHEPTYNYIKKFHSFIFCFTYSNSFYYVDCLSGNYLVSPLFNSCEICSQNKIDSTQSIQKLAKASRYMVMIDSNGNYVQDTLDSWDIIFFQMNQVLSQRLCSVYDIFEIQECRYDYTTGKLTNYCTGEVVPQEISDIVTPFLIRIKDLYPSAVRIKFCARIPI